MHGLPHLLAAPVLVEGEALEVEVHDGRHAREGAGAHKVNARARVLGDAQALLAPHPLRREVAGQGVLQADVVIHRD
jgi:hypothetical protein